MIGASCSLTCVVCYPNGGLEIMKWIFCLVAFGVGLFFYNSQCHAQGGKSGPSTHLSIGDTFLLDLDYGDMEVGDQKQEGAAEIQLNQEVSRRYPLAQFGSYVIEKVVIVAKSLDGKAQAELLLDKNSLFIQSIAKARGSFLSKDLETYDQVELINKEETDEGGSWEIQLRGHFIIRSAELHLRIINEKFGALRIDSESRQAAESSPPPQSPIPENTVPAQSPPPVDEQPEPELVQEAEESVQEPEIEPASAVPKLPKNIAVDVAATPKAVPPKIATPPKAVLPPKAATPKAATPKAATPKAATPKAVSPKIAPPETVLPEAVPPRKNMGVTLVSATPTSQSRPYHEVSVDLGTDEISGQNQRRVSFSVNKNNIVGIQISCLAGSTEIIEVVAVLRDGSRRALSELHGPMLSGDKLVADFDFAIPIREILVISQGRGRNAGELARYQLAAVQLQR
jgi:hypothetical protein